MIEGEWGEEEKGSEKISLVTFGTAYVSTQAILLANA